MCVHQLAKEAARRGHSVTTICYADGTEQESFDGVNVIKINAPSYLQENMSASSLVKKINRIRSICSKLIHIRNYPLRSLTLVKSYYNAISGLLKGRTQATIVASVNPLEAVIAAERYKRDNPSLVKIIYYCADTLSNEKGDSGILSADYRTKCGIKWEKRLFSRFDKVLIMECHKKHYYSGVFEEFIPKMEVVNFPLFTKLNIETRPESNGKIRFVYAGTLYKELRNPTYLCKILIQLSSKMPIEVYFLGSGDCDDILDEASQRTDGAIKRLGMQPHDIAMNYLGSADVLLSIGNAESPMAPSKIYEYMSTGKPILHTYTYENDPCIEPLKKYGNSLLVRAGDNNIQDKVAEFVLNRHNMLYNDIYDIFILSTPSYTFDLIESTAGEK